MQIPTPQTPGDLTHPSPETWMAYLYRELAHAEQAQCDAHLAACRQCQSKVAQWRRTLQALRASPALPQPAPRQHAAPFRQPALRWAIAATLLLGLGLTIGRFIIPNRPDPEAIRAAVTEEINRQFHAQLANVWETQRAQLRADLQGHQQDAWRAASALLNAADAQAQQLLLAYAKDAHAKATQDKEQLLAGWRLLDEARREEILALRKDLETVAVFTEAGLRNTEQQLVTLANYTTPPTKQP